MRIYTLEEKLELLTSELGELRAEKYDMSRKLWVLRGLVVLNAVLAMWQLAGLICK